MKRIRSSNEVTIQWLLLKGIKLRIVSSYSNNDVSITHMWVQYKREINFDIK
jgi:hypothetical protein